jgi:Tfp pilus assembly protein PilX
VHAKRQRQQQLSDDDSDEELAVRAARAKQREGHKQVRTETSHA